MFKTLFTHALQSQLRSPLWQRSLGINILLGLLVLYLMANLLFLGYFLDVLLLELAPDESPVEQLNGVLFYTLLGGLLARFLLQSFPVMSIQGYLLLPLPKYRLYRYLLGKSLLNAFNLLPFFFVLPFAIKAVFPLEGALVGWSWIALLALLVLFNHYLAFFLKRRFTVQPGVVALVLVSLAALIYLDVSGLLPLSAIFAQTVARCLQQPLWLLLPAVAVAGAVQLIYRLLQRHTYLDALDQSGQASGKAQNFAFLGRFGQIGHYLRLELKLIWRNKRPRVTLLMSLFFLTYPFLGLSRLEEGDTWYALFIFVITILFPAATYGQYLFAWESSYFNLVMARRISAKDYLEAKYYLIAAFILATSLVALLYGFIDRRALLLVLASAAFSWGVTIYLILLMATYNTRPVDASKNAMMNWEGLGASQFLLVFPALLLPVVCYGLMRFLLPPEEALLGVAALGLLGILLKQPMLRVVQRQFEQRRHALARGYRQR
jgi:hypothetical protein